MIEQEQFRISYISPEEAEQYVSEKEDYIGYPVKYFTRTPSTNPKYPAEDGWEDVTYYTGRKKNITVPKDIVGSQYIYILSNDLMPGLVKIGFTKNKVTERVKQINRATGVAEDFKVEYQFPCFNAHDLEKEIHSYLEYNGLRHNKNKEFFNISVEEGIAVIQRIGEKYKMS